MSAVQTLTPNYLLAMSQQELDELFAQLEPAPFNGIEGVFRGKLLGIKGMGLFPRSVRVLVYIVLHSALNPWRGKSFFNGRGSNLWFTTRNRFRFAHYVIDQNSTGGELNYNIKENLKPLRGIRGQARQFSQDILLARMNYQVGGRSHRILYFTLQAA